MNRSLISEMADIIIRVRRVLPGIASLLFLTVSMAQAAALPLRPVGMLGGASQDLEAVLGGGLDTRFTAYDFVAGRKQGGDLWLRLPALRPAAGLQLPVVVARQGRHLQVELYMQRGGEVVALPRAGQLAAFSGEQETLFLLPVATGDHFAEARVYARVRASGQGAEQLAFQLSDLPVELARGAAHSRLIALAFGALLAVSIAAALIWLVLADTMLLYYAALFFLQGLYIAYLSGEGFDWPLLGAVGPPTSNAWNVPVALSGAAACLFVREVAELRRYSRHVYHVFGALAVAFAVVGLANFLKPLGIGWLVTPAGNLIFAGTAVFTLVVALLAWRRGSRAAGWFLLAWSLLESCTIVAALRLLVVPAREAEGLLYYALPLSMVAAALLIALGVADRLRDQRLALSRAERHATTDALTGVMNRRALVERLEGACTRARQRRLPISLLFIDLDHFKQINDTFGHLAGDACLVSTAAAIESELGASDAIGRYGGEEFVVILSGLHGDGARAVANRIRERVAAISVAEFGEAIRLTCSIGVAASDQLGVWGEELVARADAAVYQAKRQGRNQVHVAGVAA